VAGWMRHGTLRVRRLRSAYNGRARFQEPEVSRTVALNEIRRRAQGGLSSSESNPWLDKTARNEEKLLIVVVRGSDRAEASRAACRVRMHSGCHRRL